MTIALIIAGLLLLYFAANAWALGVRISSNNLLAINESIISYIHDMDKPLPLKQVGSWILFDKTFEERVGIMGYNYLRLRSGPVLWILYKGGGKRAYIKSNTVENATQILGFLALIATAGLFNEKEISDHQDE